MFSLDSLKVSDYRIMVVISSLQPLSCMLRSDISVANQTKSRNYEAEGQSGSLHRRMASAN